MASWLENEIEERVDGVPGPAHWPAFPPSLVSTVIYANSTGNDTTGTGAIGAPFRSFVRSTEFLAQDVNRNTPVVIDMSEASAIDTEIVPAYFQMPSVQVTAPHYVDSNTLNLPFRTRTPVAIRATPIPKPGFSLADLTITAADILSAVDDPDHGLITITLTAARASWGANLLVDAFTHASYNFRQSNPINANTTTTLTLSNGNGSFVAPTGVQTLIISECSKVLQGSVSGTGVPNVGIMCNGIAGGISWQGIKITKPTSGVAMRIERAINPSFELCDIEGLQVVGTNNIVALTENCIVRRSLLIHESNTFLVRLTLRSIVSFDFGQSAISFSRVMCDGATAPFANGAPPGGGNNQRGNASIDFSAVFIRNSAGGTVAASGAIHARPGTAWSTNRTKIDGSAGDGIRAEAGASVLVQATKGTGNAGYGIRGLDASDVRVLDDATTITGTLGDMKSGTLPTRTWADFRTALPGPAPSGRGIKNEHDVNQAITGTGTMLTYAAGVVTLTSATPTLTPSMVGQLLAIPSAPTPVNAGVFAVASYVDASNITFANPDGVTEAFAGTWKVLSTYAQGEEVTGASSGGRSGSRIYQRPL